MNELNFALENQYRSSAGFILVGIDEAGRGPLAGPVVAGAVILPEDFEIGRLNDSKKLTAARREELFHRLTVAEKVRYAIAFVGEAEIDRLNILRATHLAMAQAVSALKAEVDFCLIDGLDVPNFPYPQKGIVKGDAKCPSIAAAGILAKVARDRKMMEYHEEFPQYGFAQHKGYGTKQHLAALAKHGPCRIHRRSFQPVAQRLLPFAEEKWD